MPLVNDKKLLVIVEKTMLLVNDNEYLVIVGKTMLLVNVSRNLILLYQVIDRLGSLRYAFSIYSI